MAWTFVDSPTPVVSTANSETINKPAGVAVGDAMVYFTRTNTNNPAACTGGWFTQVDLISSSNRRLQTWVRICDGTEPATFTFTTTGTASTFFVNGCALRPPAGNVAVLDVNASASNASSTVLCAPSVVSSTADDGMIWFSHLEGGGTITAPSGYTKPAVGDVLSTFRQAVAYKLSQASGATGDIVGTAGSAAINYGFVVAFKAVTAVSGSDTGTAVGTEAVSALTSTISQATDTSLITGTTSVSQMTVLVSGSDTSLLSGTEGYDLLAAIKPNPSLMLLPLSGSLSGQDKSGSFSATGSGALRYLATALSRINLMPNPSFEVFAWAPTGGATVTRVTGDGTSGNACMEISSPVAGDGANQYGVNADEVVPGQTYTLSFDAKWISGATDWRVVFQSYTAANNQVGSTTNVPLTISAGVWTRYTASYVVPTSPTGTHRIRIHLTRDSSVASTVRFDSVQVEAGSVATSYFDGSTGGGAAWIHPQTGMTGTAHDCESFSTVSAFVEETANNAILNPFIDTAQSGWTSNGCTLSMDGNYQRRAGFSSCKIVTSNLATGEGIRVSTGQVPAATGQTWTGSVWLRGSGTVIVQISERDAGGAVLSSSATAAITLADRWSRYILTRVLSQAGTTNITLEILTSTQQVATWWATDAQLEQRAYATSFIAGSLGTGYSWAGTASASISTRSATIIRVDETNRILSQIGAIVAWFLRDSDSGSSQFISNLGDIGTGKDQVGLRVGSTDELIHEWTSNGASATTTLRPGATSTGLFLLAYAGWNGVSTEVAVGAENPTAGTRDAPQGNLVSSNHLTVGSSVSGTSQLDGRIGPVLVVDRLLAVTELTNLVRQTTPWNFTEFGTSSGDVGVLGVTESSSIVAANNIAGSDTGLVSSSSSVSLVVTPASVSDTGFISVIESASLVVTPSSVSDTGFIVGTLSSTISGLLSANDASLISVSESSSVVANPIATVGIGSAASTGISVSAQVPATATTTIGSAASTGIVETARVPATATETIGLAVSSGSTVFASYGVLTFTGLVSTGNASATGITETARSSATGISAIGVSVATGIAETARASATGLSGIGIVSATGITETAKSSATGIVAIGQVVAIGISETALASVKATTIIGQAIAVGILEIATVDASAVVVIGEAILEGYDVDSLVDGLGIVFSGEAGAFGSSVSGSFARPASITFIAGHTTRAFVSGQNPTYFPAGWKPKVFKGGSN